MNSLFCSPCRGQVAIWFLLTSLVTTLAQAQDVEDVAGAQGISDTATSRMEGDGAPPQVTGALRGSAVDTLLLEDGVEVGPSRYRRSPWGGRYYGLYSADLVPIREGVGQLSAYNYLSLDYRISWEKRFSIRPEFFMNTAGRSMFGDGQMGFFQDSRFSWGDIYLQYSQRNLGLFFDRVGLFGAFRLYLPISDDSKRQAWIAKINPRLSFQAPLGNGYWIQYHLRSMLFMHTQSAYVSQFFKTKANEAFRLENWVQFSKFFGSNSWGLHQMVYVKHRWYHGSDSNNIAPEINGVVGASTQASVNISGLFLQGGFSWERVVGQGGDRLPYDETETSLMLQVGTRL